MTDLGNPNDDWRTGDWRTPDDADTGGDGGNGERPWWFIPAAIVPVIVLLGLIGAALDNSDGDTVATSDSTSTSTTARATTSSTVFATATTRTTLSLGTTTSSTATTLATVTTTTRANTATTAATGGSSNKPLTISASWAPNPARVGEPVIFDVTASDPDAGPINECGGSPPGGFGDGPYGGVCQVDCAAPSVRTASSRAFQYSHTYTQPGTYNVRFTYQSAGGCTSGNPGASQRTLSFNVTVNP